MELADKTGATIYISDHGIRESVFGNNMRDINQTLENIVYMELLGRGYSLLMKHQKGHEDVTL